MPNSPSVHPALRFVLTFILLFGVFYYFNVGFFSLTSPGSRHYVPFLDRYCNYIRGLRWLLLHASAALLNGLGYTAITSEYQLLVAGRGFIQLVYACLGLGVMSFFAAFVLAYPKGGKHKYAFLAAGLLIIQVLNIVRFVLLALYWNGREQHIADHHTLFDLTIYALIMVSLYFWVNSDTSATAKT